MDFRKELAKELRLGAIAENTMLDDYVKACEAIAVRYHESKVKEFRLGGVSGNEALRVSVEFSDAELNKMADKDYSYTTEIDQRKFQFGFRRGFKKAKQTDR